MLEITEVTKRFGKVVANDAVSLRAQAGQVVGLLGHNGAGKTTLVNQIVGIAKPDRGSIRLDGIDAVARPGEARRRCAAQAQAQVPITGLTPALAVELVGRLRGAPKDAVRARWNQRVEALDLGEWADRPTEKLSGGAKRLIAFCIATAVPLPVVVLDEPTNDVDPLRRRLLWSEIRRIADDGAAVLLVTHNVNEAERAVDRLVVLDEGRVIGSGTPGQMTADLRGSLRLELRWQSGATPPQPPGVHPLEVRDGLLTGTLDTGAAGGLVSWASGAQAAGEIETFALAPASLEDAYVAMTGRSDSVEVAA